MAESLRELQTRFAAHLRDPEHEPAPEGVEDRRMAIYRDLFFRNISNFIAKSFPVLRRLHNDQEWRTLLREFYRSHESHTPLFPEIPREFLQFLQNQAESQKRPFMAELAHYEWVEIALDLDATDLADTKADPGGDLLTQIPVFSPLAWPLNYQFPVHQIRPDFQPSTAPEQATHLLVYRNPEDQVKFMHLNAVSALLVHLLKDNRELSGREILEAVAKQLDQSEPARIVAAGSELLNDLRQREILLGTLG